MSEVTKAKYKMMTVGALRHQLSRAPDMAEVMVCVLGSDDGHQVRHVVMDMHEAWVNIVIEPREFVSPAPSDGAEAAK